MSINEIFNLKTVHEVYPIDMNNIKDFHIMKKYIHNDIIYCQYNEENIFIIKDEEDFIINSISLLNKENEYNIPLFLSDNNIIKSLKKIYLENKYSDDIIFEETDDDLSDTQKILNTNFDLLSDNDDGGPIIQLLNSIIFNAIQKNSSDIHIESHETYGEIRFRINGILEKFITIDKKIIINLSNRIKFLSLLNTSEKKKAQDGQMSAQILNEKIDIRISIIPTYYGERVVMRLLMNSHNIKKVEELGFDNETMNKLEEITKKSFGIFLVAGPTGSGKTTTLHSFLKQKNNDSINIITVEDPIEYKTDYANQIQVSKNNNFDFNNALRAVLRQDPDVLMIGEIRDNETANIAIQSALTGHYVLSSIHANDSISCISRLLEMNIEEYLIKDAVLGILSQRLVRINCDCKKENKKGCPKCNFTGYSSRRIIYELLIFDENIKNEINNFTNKNILDIAKNTQKFVPMKEKLDLMLKENIIDKEEYDRIGL